MWHAKQIEKQIAKMPAELAQQIIADFKELEKELTNEETILDSHNDGGSVNAICT